MKLRHAYEFEAIGTPWSIETDRSLSLNEVRGIHKLIDEFDQTYSRFRADSVVSRARREAPDSYVFPASIVELYDIYILLERITHGAVNPLVGDTLERLGYDANYTLHPAKTEPDPPASFVKTITRSGTTLAYDQPVLLDIGAIGKGYLVDAIAKYVARHHAQYIVDAGGDIAICTATPTTIGLEHPLDPGQVIGTVNLKNQSICGSSSNRRNWGEGLHHIIDARTGRPIHGDIIATWAIVPTTMLADALATALFFVPAAKLRRHFGDFKYVTMAADGQIDHDITDVGRLYVDAV